MRILITLATAATLWVGCNSTPQAADLGASASNATQQPDAKRAAPTATNDRRTALSKNWKKGNDGYLYLNIEGSFEGMLDPNVVSTGRWELDEEKNLLTLKKDHNGEGKVTDAVVKFTVLENTESKLKLKDANDKEWEFAAQ